MLQKIKTRSNVLTATVLMVVVLIAFLVFSLLFGSKVHGENQTYYSGDAASYNNSIVIASVNSGKLELFTMSDGTIARRFILSSVSEKYPDFNSVVLQTSENKLYAYTTNGRYVYQYDISDLNNPILSGSAKDNAWDWFFSVKKTNNHIMTIGTRGIKIWNKDMQVINEYANPDKQNTISMSSDESLIFDLRINDNNDEQNDFISIVDTANRNTLLEQPIVFNKSIDRKIYFDNKNKDVYVVGDRVLKKINLSSREVKNYSHESNEGYAAIGSRDGNVYFSNGKSITKMDSSMNVIDAVDVSQFNIFSSWAMDMAAVIVNGKEYIVVFNNSNIAVLNENLELAASYKAGETSEVDDSLIADKLAIALSAYKVFNNETINVAGAGFAPSEKITVTFEKQGAILGDSFEATTDSSGRFRVDIVVPEEFSKKIIPTLPVAIDVRAEGKISERHISTSLNIME